MVRIVSFVLAVAFGLCAGVLAVSGATVAYAGQTRHCAGPIVSMEIGDVTPPITTNATDRALTQACERKDDQYLLLAGLAGLLCLAASAAATHREGRVSVLPRARPAA
ncbi:hypothetical protein [Nocardioides sp. InS609-2]|uniref:hypothetical protein n=1 Tax=Nocardioides sp. InS609-2 TaxID=2760705 RepID=UPI0020BE77D3|nr:hypothetical protein [Nocardioides sp. InS609-2]